jgi:hypothetical protein
MTDSNTPEYPEASSAPAVPPSTPTGEFVARAGQYYRRTRYLMVVMLLGYGIYSLYDGFIHYPRDNQAFIDKEKAAAAAKGQNPDKVNKDTVPLPHPGLDVPFNQVFGIILPPLSLIVLVHVLRKSRGEIRFDGKTLSAPGHPPVPVENISAIDQRLWERKGIAYIDYDLGERKGRIMLDDFIYEREPIDGMYKAIVDQVAPEESSTSVEQPQTPSA